MFIINPYVFGEAATYLLDDYPATLAFSLRKLDSAYSGSAIRVRRDSDNAEQDIGFSGGDLDTASLESFCTGANGFITTWYDQQGSNDALATIASYQPKIHDSSTGTLTDPNNGLPAMLFDGTNTKLALTSAINTQQVFYYHIVFNRASTGVMSVGLAYGSASTAFPWLWFTNNGIYSGMGTGTSVTLHDASQTGTGDFLATTLRDSSNNIKMWRNGSADTTKTVADGSNTIDYVGQRSGAEHNGYMQEVIYWASDEESNRSTIETDVNTYYSIW